MFGDFETVIFHNYSWERNNLGHGPFHKSGHIYMYCNTHYLKGFETMLMCVLTAHSTLNNQYIDAYWSTQFSSQRYTTYCTC